MKKGWLIFIVLLVATAGFGGYYYYVYLKPVYDAQEKKQTEDNKKQEKEQQRVENSIITATLSNVVARIKNIINSTSHNSRQFLSDALGYEAYQKFKEIDEANQKDELVYKSKLLHAEDVARELEIGEWPAYALDVLWAMAESGYIDHATRGCIQMAYQSRWSKTTENWIKTYVG